VCPNADESAIWPLSLTTKPEDQPKCGHFIPALTDPVLLQREPLPEHPFWGWRSETGCLFQAVRRGRALVLGVLHEQL